MGLRVRGFRALGLGSGARASTFRYGIKGSGFRTGGLNPPFV